MPAASTLTLADKISDPFMPEFDPSLLEFPERNTEISSKKDDPLVWNSQVVSEPSIEIGREAPIRDQRADFDEDDMNIDLGLDLDEDDGPSLEFARHALPPMEMDDDLLGNAASKDFDLDKAAPTRLSSEVPSLVEDREEPEDQLPDNGGMVLDDDFGFPVEDDQNVAPNPTNAQPSRTSQSPLSSLPSDDLQERDITHIIPEEDEEPSIRQAPHKAKKRKVLPNDSVTMLTSETIKKQQADRSAILKPMQFLPRDQVLLNLMNLQRKGGFVSNIIGDGPIKGLAPELRGVLSIEVVRKSSQLKRKRDNETPEVNGAQGLTDQSHVQLEIPEDETRLANDDNDSVGGEPLMGEDVTLNVTANDDVDILPNNPAAEDDDLDGLDDLQDRFNETTAPLLHPMEQGAISQGTKHAVHLLRDRFGSSVDGTPSQKKTSILFQELLPERSTSKADATKMFFETLVLATKDAIKVEQGEKEVGSNIRIRAKRGLWGAWAEKEAGGEIAGQEQEAAPVAVAA